MPGWIVSPMPSIVHPERSTDSVADGFVELDVLGRRHRRSGWYWISLITTFGSADLRRRHRLARAGVVGDHVAPVGEPVEQAAARLGRR